MASVTPITAPGKARRAGLGHWMNRVLKECHKVQGDWDADKVHDLRVALRRCRSMADGLREVDPDPSWRKMKKAGRKLFRALGDLRDTHVMADWTQKLASEDDRVRARILEVLGTQEKQDKDDAEKALERFDHKEWRQWAHELPQRARRVPREGLVFQHIALQRWTEARDLHAHAMRVRSRLAYHQLRIGLKRFRYTVENFLPRRHATWGADLKQLQDLLGEVHDLDVLRGSLRKAGSVYDAAVRSRWQDRIKDERDTRLDQYRARMKGNASLFSVWRAGLPDGKRLESAVISKLSAWAGFLDPEFKHAQHVATLALQLFDGCAAAKIHEFFRESRARRILHGAALLHEVGRAEGDAGHHKAAYRLIRDLEPPLGWTADEIKCMALVARYHRGAEPRAKHEGFGALSPAEQQSVTWLAALLRFADSFDGERDGRVTHLEVENAPEAILVRARGYIHDLTSAARTAEQKHLLESVCGRPVIIRSDSMEVAAPVLASKAS